MIWFGASNAARPTMPQLEASIAVLNVVLLRIARRKRTQKMTAKISKCEWERRISEVGYGRYDFIEWTSQESYGKESKVTVICVVDKYKWSVKVGNLMSLKHGCPQCGGHRRWTSEEREEQINGIKNIEFIEWVGEYTGAKSKAKLRCSVDGYEWVSSVDSLLNKSTGCHKCSKRIRWTKEERISQINDIDGISFVKFLGEYAGGRTRVAVSCDVHNIEWAATITNIVNHGSGCPSCAKGGYDQTKTGYLYALRSECGKYVKVGISNKPESRFVGLRWSTPFKFNVIEMISGDGADVAKLEKYIHRKHESAGF